MMDERARAISTAIVALAMLLVTVVGLARRPVEIDQATASRPITYRIDPNTADAATLCLLPQVGPGIADRIVRDREANGPFASASEMQRVPYVGEKTAAAISPWVRIESGHE